ncbi:hypothetical protein C8Q79DRAFT_905431 [Trametes meyenii]|nr:hypothetical protein C8Q79DRAFT_905431 [Trametes meyenii]
MSAIVSIGEKQFEIDSIKYLVVFGDSFSSIGYNERTPPPTAEQPLGVPFPGETSCERLEDGTQDIVYDPNWVGYFTQEVNALREDSPLLVFDYAVAGDTVSRVKLVQVGRKFLPTIGSKSERTPGTLSETLFVTWIGINDCVWNLRLRISSSQASLDDFFAAQERLYEAGARHFLFIDIPPAHTFPKGPKMSGARAAFEAWNPLLCKGAKAFSSAHSDAMVAVFSSWDLFTRILADPSSFRLVASTRDALFVDGFHPSSAVHTVVAREVLAFLKGVSASDPPSGSLLPPRDRNTTDTSPV